MGSPLRFGICRHRNQDGVLLPSFCLLVCRLLLLAYPLACPFRWGLLGLSGAFPGAILRRMLVSPQTIALRRLLRRLLLGGRVLGT